MNKKSITELAAAMITSRTVHVVPLQSRPIYANVRSGASLSRGQYLALEQAGIKAPDAARGTDRSTLDRILGKSAAEKLIELLRDEEATAPRF